MITRLRSVVTLIALFVLVTAMVSPKVIGQKSLPGFVLLPGGSFEMGDHHGFVDPKHGSDETPIHKVRLDSFYIGINDVTGKEYCEFLNSAQVGRDVLLAGLRDRILASAELRVVSARQRIGQESGESRRAPQPGGGRESRVQGRGDNRPAMMENKLPASPNPGHLFNAIFKVHRYSPDYPGLAGRDLIAKGVIELPASEKGKTGLDQRNEQSRDTRGRPGPRPPRENQPEK